MDLANMTPTELFSLAEQLKALGQSVQVSKEELQTYYPQVDMSFYVPKAPPNFYYNPKIFRRLLGIPEGK